MLRTTSKNLRGPLPAGPVAWPRKHYRGVVDNNSTRFEDHRDPTGVGRQLDQTYPKNRRVFTNYDSRIVLPKAVVDYRLAARKEDKLAATSIQTMKNSFSSVAAARNFRPFSNRGLDFMFKQKEGRHLSVVSMSYPKGNTINRDHMAHSLFRTVTDVEGNVVPNEEIAESYLPKSDELADIFPGPAEELAGHLIPFEVTLGYRVPHQNEKPSRHGNVELNKTAHFMHATPVALKKHCTELKDFMTEFPSELKAVLETGKLSEEEKFPKHAFNRSLGADSGPETMMADVEVEYSDELPMVLHTTDYLSSRAIMADPRANKAEIRISLNSLDLEPKQRMKFIDLVQSHEVEATKGYHPIHHEKGRTPGLSGEVVCRYDNISECLVFQSKYMPTRSQNIDFLVNSLQRLFKAAETKYAFEKDLVYDCETQSVSSQQEIDERYQEKVRKYSRYGIDSKKIRKGDAVSELQKRDIQKSKFDQLEDSREAYEKYAQEMMGMFNVQKNDRIKRNKQLERRSFAKNDPIPKRRSQVNNVVLGGHQDRYWHQDGNKHYNMNIGNI